MIKQLSRSHQIIEIPTIFTEMFFYFEETISLQQLPRSGWHEINVGV